MIIHTDDSKKPDPLEEFRKGIPEGEPHSEEPPPSYNDLEPTEASVAREPPSVSRVLNVKPTNFVYISRPNGSLKGEWVIDPSILIPPPLLPDLKRGETEEMRKNLFLESNNGAIAAEVTVLPSTASDAQKPWHRKQASLHARSSNGSVTLNLHDTPFASGYSRIPVKVDLYASNGAIQIQLPRSFRGTVVSHTWNGSTRFSDDVKAKLQHIKEDGRIMRTFVGDFTEDDFQDGVWRTDEVNAESRNGSVRIQFDDEVKDKAGDKGKSSSGFFSMLRDLF